jgi:hypothetical protein
MPTVITPIRSDNAYFGFGKEVPAGTPVAPYLFPRWEDGSTIEIDTKMEELWEGDATRHLSLLVKNQQSVKFKLTIYPRMNEISFFEELAMGVLSDSIAMASPSTTLSANVSAGGTSFSVASASGFPTTGLMQLILSPGTANAETVTVSLPASGTTFSLAGAATLKNAHSSGDAVASVTAANTSFASSAVAGATTISLNNNLGLTGASPVALVLSPGTANEEMVSVTTPVSGTGPYTATLANGATLKKSHASADLVSSPVSHVMTDKTDGDYCTIECGLGSLFGSAGITIRVRSCKLDTIKRSAKSGGVLTYEMEFTGIACSVQSTPATITLEQHPPFLYVQGSWTLDGSTTGDALNIEQFDIQQKNALDLTQTEQLTPAALIFGNLTVDVAFDVVYINGSRIQQVYFGSSTGSSDSQTVYLGAFSVTFAQPDGFQSVTYTVFTIAYTKVGMPQPKKDGKHSSLALSTSAISNQGQNANLIQVTVNNTQYQQN